MFKRILVAYDEGKAAAKALGTAIDLAKATSGEIYIASAYLTEDNPGRLEFLAKLQSEAVKKVTEQGLVAHRRLEAGERSLGKVITRIAEESKADVVVMGTNNRGAIGRIMFGSVSDFLLHNLTCPVMIIK